MKRSIIVKLSVILTFIVIAAAIVIGSSSIYAASPASEPWSFGVIGDTQWTVPADGYNPNTCSANIIKSVDQQFIQAGVKFVVSIGDTVDMGETNNIYTRALYAQDLYNAGIGFYPLRGNHEVTEGDAVYPNSAAELQYAFPQIGTGVNNHTPNSITASIIPADVMQNNSPAVNTGKVFIVGTSFDEPRQVNHDNNSLSYSFRYNNATFVLLDQFDVNSSYTNSTIPQQMDWINKTLALRAPGTQAFVFAHKNLLGQNHKDNLFGANIVPSDPAAGQDPGDGSSMNTALLTADEKAALTSKQAAMNSFIATMQANQAPLFISGHDHIHNYSQITSPDGQSQVNQLIIASDSSKFYTPKSPYSTNETILEQDKYRVGYYIFTVDGSKVTIDCYHSANGNNYYGLNGGTFNFEKFSTITYDLP